MALEIRYYNAYSSKDDIQFVTEFSCFLGHSAQNMFFTKWANIDVFFFFQKGQTFLLSILHDLLMFPLNPPF